MNRAAILGLPIAKSILYDRRSIIKKSLKTKILRRNNHTISSFSPRQNNSTKQSNGFLEEEVKVPVSHELFRTDCVMHTTTRRRVLLFCE